MSDALPPAVEVVNPQGVSDCVLLCEHASNYVPPDYGGLGLGEADLARHIAWDIGAAAVARRLAILIDAPLLLSGYSRLLIDCNRPLATPTSIPEISETTIIPGNIGIGPDERQRRADRFYAPFQKAVTAHLDWRKASGRPAVVIGIHSFTPVFKGFVRPWHAGVLFRKSREFAAALLARLQAPGLIVAANEPYCIDDQSDYTVPVHGEARGLDAVLIEIRQDLISNDSGPSRWSDKLAAALMAREAEERGGNSWR